jgi:hypothetical protein
VHAILAENTEVCKRMNYFMSELGYGSYPTLSCCGAVVGGHKQEVLMKYRTLSLGSITRAADSRYSSGQSARHGELIECR